MQLLSFFTWPFNSANEQVVAGVGFWMTVIGFGFTWYSLSLARRQIRKTMDAAKAAKAASEGIRLRVRQFEATQELSQAKQLLDQAREQASDGDWAKTSASLEGIRRCIIRMKLADFVTDENLLALMDGTLRQLNAMCKRIDYASEGAEAPGLPAIQQQTRDLFDVLSKIERTLQERSM